MDFLFYFLIINPLIDVALRDWIPTKLIPLLELSTTKSFHTSLLQIFITLWLSDYPGYMVKIEEIELARLMSLSTQFSVQYVEQVRWKE